MRRQRSSARPKFRMRDLADESLAGVLARPARTALTTLGTVLGIASLVATLGISRTAGNQIVERFSELAATQVTVQARQSSSGSGSGQANPAMRGAAGVLPWDVETRLDRLNGVVASGAIADVPNPGGIRTVPFIDPTVLSERAFPVFAASPGLFDAVRGHLAAGRWFDQGHVQRRDRVAVLGVDIANELGITRIDNLPGVFIGDDLFTVIGIIDDAPRDRGLTGGIIITSSAAAWRSPSTPTRPNR